MQVNQNPSVNLPSTHTHTRKNRETIEHKKSKRQQSSHIRTSSSDSCHPLEATILSSSCCKEVAPMTTEITHFL